MTDKDHTRAIILCAHGSKEKKYEEDFLLCSKIEEAMGTIPKVESSSLIIANKYKNNNNLKNLYRGNY